MLCKNLPGLRIFEKVSPRLRRTIFSLGKNDTSNPTQNDMAMLLDAVSNDNELDRSHSEMPKAQQDLAEDDEQTQLLNKRVHMCEQCGRKFDRTYNLKQHGLTHQSSQQRPSYQCMVCEKIFSRRRDLTRHEKVNILRRRAIPRD